MNETIGRLLVFTITVICFTLLVCATAGDSWLTTENGTIGLWKVCLNNFPCVDGKYFDWFDTARALCVISTMIGGLAMLFASTSIFLPEGHRLQLFSSPFIVGLALFLAG